MRVHCEDRGPRIAIDARSIRLVPAGALLLLWSLHPEVAYASNQGGLGVLIALYVAIAVVVSLGVGVVVVLVQRARAEDKRVLARHFRIGGLVSAAVLGLSLLPVIFFVVVGNL